jgi:hypothetical protein
MAADLEQPRSDHSFTWVRCSNCRAGLWKRYSDHLEMTVSPRGGQTRMIVVPLEAAAAVQVTCEKCLQVTVVSAERDP